MEIYEEKKTYLRNLMSMQISLFFNRSETKKELENLKKIIKSFITLIF